MSKEPQTKNPASLYDCADLLQITRDRGAIPRSLMKGDIELLLNTFMAKTQHTFKAFDTTWNELNFDHIHFACLSKENRHFFMNALYEDVFDKLSLNIDQAKYGVIYALYFLFTTQPSTWPIRSIRVDIDRWTKLFNFYLQCCHSNTKEGAQAAMVFRKMKDDLMAFTFTVDYKFETASILEKKEMEASHSIIDGYRELESRRLKSDATSTCYDSTTKNFTTLAQQYQKLKQQACMTPQATLVTQRYLKNTMNINETDLRKLQNVMLKSVLAAKETTFIDSVKEAGRRMWTARADYGLADTDIMLPHQMPPRIYAEKPSQSELPEEEPQHQVSRRSEPEQQHKQQQQHIGNDVYEEHQTHYSSSSDVASP